MRVTISDAALRVLLVMCSEADLQDGSITIESTAWDDTVIIEGDAGHRVAFIDGQVTTTYGPQPR